jgi:hypothetical protein
MENMYFRIWTPENNQRRHYLSSENAITITMIYEFIFRITVFFFYFFHRRYPRGLKTRRFGNWISFRPQMKEKTPSQLSRSERSSLDHWTRCLPSSPEDKNRSSFRNVVFSSLWNTERWRESKNPVILSVIHHRQNPIESTRIIGKIFVCHLRVI